MEGWRDRKERESGEFWLSELISVSGRREDWWTLQGEGVCLCVCRRGAGEASVNTDVLTSEKENVCRGVTCVDASGRRTLHCIPLSAVMESVGLDPSAFPHPSQPHSLCQSGTLAVTSDPTPSCTTRRANRSKLALQTQRSGTAFPHEAAALRLPPCTAWHGRIM